MRRIVFSAGRQSLWTQPFGDTAASQVFCSKARVCTFGRKSNPIPEVILVEGLFDYAALWEAGFHNVTARWNPAQCAPVPATLRRSRTVYLVFDADGNASGQRASDCLSRSFRERGISPRLVSLPEGHDPNSFFVQPEVSDFKCRSTPKVLLAERYGGYCSGQKKTAGAAVARLPRPWPPLFDILFSPATFPYAPPDLHFFASWPSSRNALTLRATIAMSRFGFCGREDGFVSMGTQAYTAIPSSCPTSPSELSAPICTGRLSIPRRWSRSAGFPNSRKYSFPARVWSPTFDIKSPFGEEMFDYFANSKKLVKFEAGLTTLAYLRLGEPGLKRLKPNVQLKDMRVSLVTIKDPATLAPFVNMETLDLNDANIMDEMMPGLAGMKKLRRLTMVGTLVTDDGLKYLPRPPRVGGAGSLRSEDHRRRRGNTSADSPSSGDLTCWARKSPTRAPRRWRE